MAILPVSGYGVRSSQASRQQLTPSTFTQLYARLLTEYHIERQILVEGFFIGFVSISEAGRGLGLLLKSAKRGVGLGREYMKRSYSSSDRIRQHGVRKQAPR